MKLIKKIILLFIFIMLVGCAGLGDYDIALSGNYSIVRTSAHQVMISPQVDTGLWGGAVIPAKVTEVAWNDSFIIAKQLGLKTDPKSSNNYKIPDEDKQYYWIIDVKIDKVYGPLSKENYETQKRELQIPGTLVLQKVSKLNPE